MFKGKQKAVCSNTVAAEACNVFASGINQIRTGRETIEASREDKTKLLAELDAQRNELKSSIDNDTRLIGDLNKKEEALKNLV